MSKWAEVSTVTRSSKGVQETYNFVVCYFFLIMYSRMSVVDFSMRMTKEDLLRCLVCGEQCFHRNYGAVCCNACATFFRRSIKQNRTYVCKQNENCCTEHSSKRICMFCRFQKCISIGINIDFVIARHQTQSVQFIEEDGMYEDVVNSFTHALTQRASAQKTFTRTTEACLFDQFCLLEMEQKIIGDYLQQTELTQILSKHELSLFIDHLLPFWFFIHCSYYTLRNNGHTQNKLYMIDEKGVDVTPDASRRFVEGVPIPGLQNVDVVSAKTHDVHVTWMNGAKNFHENQIQLHDFAIICHILVLRLAIEMFPQKPEPREQLNKLFRSIRHSIDENHQNAEIRMGNMLLLINDVMRCVNEAHEWEIIFTLSLWPQNKELPCYNETGGSVEYLKKTVNTQFE